MRRAALAAAWVSVAAVTAAFFLPWARVDLRGVTAHEEAGRVSRVTLQVRGFPRQVSGAHIPGLARQEDAQVMVALLELLTNTRQHATLKSYAVFLVPGVALLCGLLLTGWSDRPAVTRGVAVICAAAAAGGGWKLLALEPGRSAIAVTIGSGLWISVGAYVGLAASAVLAGRSGRERT